MNELQIFSNPEFGQIRTVEMNGEPWLVGKDVCAAFGDKNHNRSLGKVDAEDKKTVPMNDSMGRTQQITIINESGLYALLFAMQPQKANNGGISDAYPIEIQKRIDKLRKFKRWVTSEVLPSIRRSGSYVLGKKESEQIRRLQELQDKIQGWKQLEQEFDASTAFYRKAYERVRTNRDRCRVNIRDLEQAIANLIGQLNQMPQIR